MKRPGYHRYSRSSLKLLEALASEIRASRKELGWTEALLAERLGCSRDTVRAIEAASPSVAVGTVFEAAHILRLPLLGGGMNAARLESEAQARLALLPQRVRPPRREISDAF